ncbi:MAG: hypothetical protein V4672_22890 [Verrucomicrobiota bacterium]
MFWDIIGKVSGVLGIVSFFVSPFFIPQGYLPLVYAIYLCLTNAALVFYLFYVHRTKRHRYADIVEQFHFVNHTIRDWLHTLQHRLEHKQLRGEDFEAEFVKSVVSQLDQIANAFSHICGKRCAVCIKELLPGRQLKVAYRDSASKLRRGKYNNKPHPIEEDTPCHSLYEPKEPTNHYLCNDVITEWDENRYNSPTFKNFANPKLIRIGNFRFPRYWPLHYRSCLVVPIRFATCDLPPASGSTGQWNYWGFLCIDCGSRNVFDRSLNWLVAGTFADIMYVYFSATFAILDKFTQPE